MDKKLWALAVSIWLAFWWQEALASDKPVELRNPTVWHTIEEVRWDVQNCIGKWLIKLPDWECAIMVDLVDESPRTTTPIEQEISQFQERWKEMQKEELIKFWWGITWIIGIIIGLVYAKSNNNKKQNIEHEINILLHELNGKFSYLTEIYPDWFINIYNTEISEIQEELTSCCNNLASLFSDENLEDTKETKIQKQLIISKLEKLRKRIDNLDKKFTPLNSEYIKREKIEESFR